MFSSILFVCHFHNLQPLALRLCSYLHPANIEIIFDLHKFFPNFIIF